MTAVLASLSINLAQDMYAPVLPLFFLTLYVRFNLAVLIGFNGRPSASPVSQICGDLDAPDICCIPLDLDIVDGRNYGWFRAEKVAFTNIPSPNTFSAVYGMTNEPACSGEIITHSRGDRDWRTQFPITGGAGSALAISTPHLKVVPEGYPHLIIVAEVRYKLIGRTGTDLWWYRNDQSRIIFGRKFRVTSSSSATSNRTSADDTTPEKPIPRTVT